MKYTGISWGYFYSPAPCYYIQSLQSIYNVIEHYIIFLLTIFI